MNKIFLKALSFLALTLPVAAIAEEPAPVPSPSPSIEAAEGKTPEDVPQTIPGSREYTVAPIVAEGAPIDVLKYDPVLPSQTQELEVKGATGSITKELQNSLPFHFAENAKPGSASTITGSVRGAEEIDVSVLGVPLNFPQGGGFYLQSFPQYIWSGYTFQFGPSMGAFDPRGVAGSLNLRLWSSETINAGEKQMEAGAFASTAEIQQFYTGMGSKDYALRAGYGTGDVEGPAGSLSARVLDGETVAVKLHLIGTSQKVEGFQSERSVTATADYTTNRGIAIGQVDAKLGGGWLLKNSLFYDVSYLKTEDPLSSTIKRERAHIYQGGIESALVNKDWRIGFGARQTDYHRLAFSAPTENLLNVQATYSIRPSDVFLIEPTLGGTAVTRLGFKPTVTLGSRYDFKEYGTGVFTRIGLHHRFPSLLDRYYSLSAGPATLVLPNPDLEIERVYSAEIGADLNRDQHKGSITGFLRYSKDTRYDQRLILVPPFTVVRPAQIINAGDSYQFGALASYDYDVASFFTAGVRGNFTKARYKDVHEPILYTPELIGILVTDFHDPKNIMGLEIAQRVSSEYFGASETDAQITRLPGYYYMDASVRYRFVDTLTLSLGVENVFDRQIEFRQNQRADVGRYFTASVTGIF